jgi:hypothetical protein
LRYGQTAHASSYSVSCYGILEAQRASQTFPQRPTESRSENPHSGPELVTTAAAFTALKSSQVLCQGFGGARPRQECEWVLLSTGDATSIAKAVPDSVGVMIRMTAAET